MGHQRRDEMRQPAKDPMLDQHVVPIGAGLGRDLVNDTDKNSLGQVIGEGRRQQDHDDFK